MIIRKVPALSCPTYTLSKAMKIGIKNLLLSAPFGKIFILSENNMLLGYYSAEHYKNTGTLDMQYDTVYLQQGDDDSAQDDISIPLSADGTDYDILPIVSNTGKVSGAVFCTDEAWHTDKAICLSRLEYLSEKGLSMDYWFTSKNYKKVAFWGLNDLSLAFANEIRHCPNIEVLGIYENKKIHQFKGKRRIGSLEYWDYIVDVNFVESVKDVAELGADLLIVTDRTMRHLENSPLLQGLHMDALYALTILHSPMPEVPIFTQLNNDEHESVLRGAFSEYFNRAKTKYNALGCSFLTIWIPDEEDLNVPCKANTMKIEDIAAWHAEQNGWDAKGKEVMDFISAIGSVENNYIKSGDYVTAGDFKSEYFNYIDGSRVVLNAPPTYKNTIYLVGPCIVKGAHTTDEHTVGYYFQENINNRGLEYRVVPIGIVNHSYFGVKALDNYDIKKGDKIFVFDRYVMEGHRDLDLISTFKKLYEEYGDAFYFDIFGHCGKEASKAIADFLIDHIND